MKKILSAAMLLLCLSSVSFARDKNFGSAGVSYSLIMLSGNENYKSSTNLSGVNLFFNYANGLIRTTTLYVEYGVGVQYSFGNIPCYTGEYYYTDTGSITLHDSFLNNNKATATRLRVPYYYIMEHENE